MRRILPFGLSNSQGEYFPLVGFIAAPKWLFFPSQRLLFRDAPPGMLWLWNKDTSLSIAQDAQKGTSTARNHNISIAVEALWVPKDFTGCSSLCFFSPASSHTFWRVFNLIPLPLPSQFPRWDPLSVVPMLFSFCLIASQAVIFSIHPPHFSPQLAIILSQIW